MIEKIELLLAFFYNKKILSVRTLNYNIMAVEGMPKQRKAYIIHNPQFIWTVDAKNNSPRIVYTILKRNMKK